MIRAVKMQNVRQLIMESSADVRMDLSEIHTLNVIEFRDAASIRSVHQVKHVSMVNAVHLASAVIQHCAKL